METDYYLHNLDVEIGKEMKGYQKSFGVLEWSNDYDTTDTGTERQSVRRSRVTSKNKNKHLGDPIPDQPRRIQKVRERCRTQNNALSMWWKVALQINVQQRMVSDDESWSMEFIHIELCSLNLFSFAVVDATWEQPVGIYAATTF
jgi:hypothetical protein